MSEEEVEAPESFLASSSDPLWFSAALGIVSGVTCVLVGYPFDTVKVRMQSGAKVSFNSLASTLLRGVTSPLLAVTPAWAANFFAYGAALKCIGKDDITSITVAGGLAGLTYATVVCPFEFVKCNTQTSRRPLSETLRATVREHGVSHLYRGYGATLCRDVGQGAAYYHCAERLNRSSVLRQRFQDRTPLVAGMLTGIAHCTVEYPFDTIKTRFQTMGFSSYRELLGDMFSGGVAQGTSKLFRGYPVWLVRAPLAHGASFCVIDAVSARLR
eukprot:TRINITY_DN56061_c0_g1_i1.p1 TRINITY_DN56061_c0_g1~~TRINITY_DN56061_c0_g1_i1.p1  ORF type:complete len:297 (+),score=54.62 TRINITY_DN56061_c0_g1_i1:79-891(+)